MRRGKLPLCGLRQNEHYLPEVGTSKRIIHWLGERQHFASCCNQGICSRMPPLSLPRSCSRADVDAPLSVLHNHLLVLFPYFARGRAPFAQIHDLVMGKIPTIIDTFLWYRYLYGYHDSHYILLFWQKSFPKKTYEFPTYYKRTLLVICGVLCLPCETRLGVSKLRLVESTVRPI